MSYAVKTKVSVEKSRAEIEKMLSKHGCEEFAYQRIPSAAEIGFKLAGRLIRYRLDLPDIEDFARTPRTKQVRTPSGKYAAWEQACRQRWRALALIIKAKLEAVASGITTMEIEFLAQTMIPGGKLLHEVALPQLEDAYKTGRMPALLGKGRSKK